GGGGERGAKGGKGDGGGGTGRHHDAPGDPPAAWPGTGGGRARARTGARVLRRGGAGQRPDCRAGASTKGGPKGAACARRAHRSGGRVCGGGARRTAARTERGAAFAGAARVAGRHGGGRRARTGGGRPRRLALSAFEAPWAAFWGCFPRPNFRPWRRSVFHA